MTPAGRRRPADLIALLASLARFGLVGGASTLVHGLVLVLLVEAFRVWPAAANGMAFLAAFGVSYLGHRAFTFRSDRPHRESLLAYGLVAAGGGAGNFLLFVLLNDLMGAPYGWAFLVSFLVVTPLVYLGSRALAFRPTRPRS